MLARLRAELAARKRFDGVVTCSYCGQRYQFPVTTTIRYRAMAMAGHIEQCPFNPHNVWRMEDLVAENKWLRKRLAAVAKLAGIEVDKALILIHEINRLKADNARLRAEKAALRAAPADIGCALDVDDPYRAAEYCRTALGKPQDANPAPNPPGKPAERATGHESAGKGDSTA